MITASRDRYPDRRSHDAAASASRTAISIALVWHRQGVVCAGAGASGDAGGVSVFSNFTRSLVKPALHVGEQIGGGAGCLAAAGSGGISGGRTTSGGDGGNALAQPDSSVSSAGSISARAVDFSLGIFGYLLEGEVSAPLFRSCVCHGLARGALLRAKLFGVPVQRAGVSGLLKRDPVCLQAGQRNGCNQGPRGRSGQHGDHHGITNPAA
jgi:hypothetical protein